jgi:hypothetical protein
MRHHRRDAIIAAARSLMAALAHCGDTRLSLLRCARRYLDRAITEASA